MFNNMGMSKGDMAWYTGMLYLPWVIKPLWSPFVDIMKSKRWWIVAMQALMSAAMLLLPFLLPKATGVQVLVPAGDPEARWVLLREGDSSYLRVAKRTIRASSRSQWMKLHTRPVMSP